MSVEIKTAVEGLAKSWVDFQAADRDSKARSESERREIMEKANNALAAADAAKAAAEAAATKIGRMAVGAGGDIDPAKAEHKKAFGAFMRKGHDAGLRDIERKAVQVGVNADGGFALPESIDATIQARLIDLSPIRSLSTVATVSTSDYKRLIDIRGTASGWVGETAARTATNTPQLAERAAFMGEIYANPQVTQQSLDDLFFDVDGWLAGSVSTEFAKQEGVAFTTGDGVNKPKGFLNYTTAATADGARADAVLEHIPTGIAGDFAASNKGDVLLTTVYKLKAGHRAGAVWMTNKALLGEIRAFKESTTNAYIWQPGLVAGQPSTLLGYPVYESEDMPAKAANALAIAFGNFRAGYCVVDRVGVSTLRDPFTNKPYVGFYTTKRVGGMLLDSEAIKVVRFATT
jgi:HK97 family phage major capsid protein